MPYFLLLLRYEKIKNGFNNFTYGMGAAELLLFLFYNKDNINLDLCYTALFCNLQN